MPRKNFNKAPAPDTRNPSDEQIIAYEKNGVGNDSKPQTLIPSNEVNTSEPMGRISLDLPKSERTRFKVACATNNTTMVEELKKLIGERTEALEKQADNPYMN